MSFAIETLPEISPQAQAILYWVNAVSVGLFTVEYLLRLFVADRPLKCMLSFLGVIDLLAILPFYLSLGIDLRSLKGGQVPEDLPSPEVRQVWTRN